MTEYKMFPVPVANVWMSHFAVSNSCTVSYTHLDVYKRQH